MSNKKENAPREAPPPAPASGDISGASEKPEAPSQATAGQSATADLELAESISYQVFSDGSRRQFVLAPPNHPDYEQPMDLTIPAHWTTWPKITYDRPGDFEEAAGLVEEAYNEARLILSPVLAGGVSAVQAFQPGTNEPSEPYMEVRVRQRDMGRWPEALKVVKVLIAEHVPAQFQGVRIRFNFTRDIAFSATPATPARPKATPVSKATPTAAQETLRQKYKQEMDQALNIPQSIRNAYGDGARPLTTAERAKTVM
ncbi:hypothetical protein Slin15195_G040510 [Septoria linicola]|uniref:Uncharacterized protein n=1 Tax=Septoria linicola TaxID=215465 RepID=A0A9Q9EI76_9PEZI|nr:hypothetical protein Slin14017_G044040 [Septoria linicola]USW50732.1 hypothetical protein Slin15195_G040510 [Septoria linicola]